MLNPSPFNEKIFQINLDHVDCFILNEIEAQCMINYCADKDTTIETLQKKYPKAEFVLTLGESGSVYCGREGIIEQKAHRVNTVDTTAAGDTFTGYYLAGRLQGMVVSESLDMAAKASAIAVSRKGASRSIPFKEEVLQFEE